MLATNLTGSIQLARRVVPHCASRAAASSSSSRAWAGTSPSPASPSTTGPSGASKGYFEALAEEIAPFGISTEPGMVRTSFYDAAERVPLSEPYRGGPADLPDIPVDEMPGSQSAVAHAIIEAALSDDPPPRLLLNSDAYDLVTTALRDRLASLEAQRESTYTADAEYVPAGGA